MLLLRWLQHMLKCPTACSKNAKIKKKTFQDSCKSKNAKIQKTSRKQKKTKKQYSRSLEIGSTGKSPGILCFFVFLFFFWFSRGFLDFCIFTFARVLEYCFSFLVFSFFLAFLLLQESWNIVFCFLHFYCMLCFLFFFCFCFFVLFLF